MSLINGFGGALSVFPAIQLYKKLGWSLMGSMAVITAIILLALTPVTSRIMRKCLDGAEKSKSVEAGK